ncbi:hypothetical protein AAG570_006445 [Ranatra chinensis]|uniref:Nesprin-1 n=1 Tax=Ranatra chinensis TaxID=642074 RepID=A0ABD0YUN6_9HEMI
MQLDSKKLVAAKLGEQWANFQQVQEEISNSILSAQGQIEEVLIGVDNCSKLAPAIEFLQNIFDIHKTTEQQKDILNAEGKKLMIEDEKNVSVIQNILSSTDINWEKVNKTIKEQKNKLGEANIAWNKMAKAKDSAIEYISKAKQHLEASEVPTDLTVCALALEKAKKATEDAQKTKCFIDEMENKAQIIFKLVKPLSNFDISDIKKDLEQSQNEWQKVCERANHGVALYESQVAIWKQVEEAQISLFQWLEETGSTLTKAIENISEAEIGQAKLKVYMNEQPTFRKLQSTLLEKSQQLCAINSAESIPTLENLRINTNEQFNNLDNLAEKLHTIISSLSSSEQCIKEKIKNSSEAIGMVREQLVKCDNLTGENTAIFERLNTCRSLQEELKQQKLDDIDMIFAELIKSYPCCVNSPISKDLASLKKRYSGIVTHAEKIEATLMAFLLKHFKEKLSSLQRLVQNYKEKVTWCTPDADTDKYSLEAKILTLDDINTGLKMCSENKNELARSIKMLRSVGTDTDISPLEEELIVLADELDNLTDVYGASTQLLRKTMELWQRYDSKYDNVLSWLKEKEAWIRSHSSTNTDLAIVSEKINEIEQFKKQIDDIEPQVRELESVGEQITKCSPDMRVGHNVAQVSNRFETVKRFVISYLARLDSLKKNKEAFDESVDDARQWIEESQKKLAVFEETLTAGAKPQVYLSTLEGIKNVAAERDIGQASINKAVETGETLFAEITPANRELIRSTIRSLRDASEMLVDQGNTLTKRIEGILIQRNSFDDSYQQVVRWLADAEKKIYEEFEPKQTLQEKKLALHYYRNLAQDVSSHGSIFKQLQDKLQSLSDIDSSKKLDDILKKYYTLTEKTEEQVTACQQMVENHENYLQALEKSKDFLRTLIAEESISDRDGNEAKLVIIENLLLHESDGKKLLEICDKLMERVIDETAPLGRQAIMSELNEHKEAWQAFLDRCQKNVMSLNLLCNRWAQLQNNLDSLTNWLKVKEGQVKDQSLKSSQQTKRGHLVKLKSLDDEIHSKAEEISNLVTESVEAEPQLAENVLKVSNRHQALKNLAKEMIQRYEQYVKEHAEFDSSYESFLEWLKTNQENLNNHSEIVGDLSVLQDRQKKIRDISDLRTKECVKFDSLIDKGEKLYVHTSPDGREIIRQQLRNLRTIWDTFSEDLQNGMQKLDQCLMQFAEFSLSQEQLTKWLRDVEKAMQQHTELKGTLQEKKAQLQV